MVTATNVRPDTRKETTTRPAFRAEKDVGEAKFSLMFIGNFCYFIASKLSFFGEIEGA